MTSSNDYNCAVRHMRPVTCMHLRADRETLSRAAIHERFVGRGRGLRPQTFARRSRPCGAVKHNNASLSIMRSIAAFIFAVLALRVSSFNMVPAPQTPAASVTRVTSSPVAFMDFEDAALDNPKVCLIHHAFLQQ